MNRGVGFVVTGSHGNRAASSGWMMRLVRVLIPNSREMNNDQRLAKNPPSGKRQSGKGEESPKQLVRRIGEAPRKE